MKLVFLKRIRIVQLSTAIGIILFTINYWNSPEFPNSENKVPWITFDKIGNFEPLLDDDISQDGVLPPEDGLSKEKGLGYGMNMTFSDALSMERFIPDTRPKECKHWNYPEQMGLKASVVIAFHNEGWSTLMRTVHTILKRTPADQLKEIILVDDGSILDNLKKPLDNYIKRFNGKVKIIRNPKREGLIRTRTLGAIAAGGDILVFLDAHCEVNRNWLPPLLAPIYRDRTVLTVPIIDGIDYQTFNYHTIYSEGTLPRGIFEWGMLYKEIDMAKDVVAKMEHKSQPYKSPTHAGGLFAIERKYFHELGAYDPGLLVWGAENYELSFKVWQCGGSVEWVPCSRIGHVYRGHPFTVGSMVKAEKAKPSQTAINYKRVVEVWFDEKYKEFFYTRDPSARYLDHGDISEQLDFKKRNNCKSFAWFMENVAPDVLTDFPEPPPNAFWGEMRNKLSGQCLDTLGHDAPNKIGVYGCHGGGGSQMLRLNVAGQLGVGERCVDILTNEVSLIHCPKGIADGPWEYDNVSSTMKHKELNQCLAIDDDHKKLRIEHCDPTNPYHQWTWKEIRNV